MRVKKLRYRGCATKKYLESIRSQLNELTVKGVWPVFNNALVENFRIICAVLKVLAGRKRTAW